MGDGNVYDGLDSTSTTDALSANQGRVLYELITNVATDSDINEIFL